MTQKIITAHHLDAIFQISDDNTEVEVFVIVPSGDRLPLERDQFVLTERGLESESIVYECPPMKGAALSQGLPVHNHVCFMFIDVYGNVVRQVEPTLHVEKAAIKPQIKSP